jgi:hypothetical protein
MNDVDIVLTYDDTADGSSIVRHRRHSSRRQLVRSIRTVEVGGSDRGVTVRFDEPPSDIGDGWISLDTSRCSGRSVRTILRILEPGGLWQVTRDGECSEHDG